MTILLSMTISSSGILVQSPTPEAEILLIHADAIGRHVMLVPNHVYGKEQLEDNADVSSIVYERKKEADTFATCA